MKAQFENNVMSSFMLYADHILLRDGEAYTNHVSKFYPVQTKYNGYFAYSAPFKQIVSDSSITGANQLTGLYVDGTLTAGSDLYTINHYDGTAYYTSSKNSNTISGSYAVKDFNIYMTSQSEDQLLLETKIDLRPRVGQLTTGLQQNQKTYPAIFIKSDGGDSEGFQFGGGADKTIMNIRMIVLSDSAFTADAVCGIFKDKSRTYMHVIDQTDLPFDALGGSISGFNYQSIATGNNKVYISKVNAFKPTSVGYGIGAGSESINRNVYSSFIDFELEAIREPVK
jgi:hypothetical protein